MLEHPVGPEIRRHFIDSLKRKPQALRGLAFRDDLFPREAYRRTDSSVSSLNNQRNRVGLIDR